MAIRVRISLDNKDMLPKGVPRAGRLGRTAGQSANQYRAIMRRRLRNLFKKSIKAAIEAMAERVAVDTGMARATLIPIGRLVRALISITPLRPYRIGYSTVSNESLTSRKNYPNRLKNIPAGIALGEADLRGTEKTTYSEGKGNEDTVLYFRYMNSLYHYVLNDQHGSNNYEPWRSYQAGRAAFAATWNAGLPEAVRHLRTNLIQHLLRFRNA